MYMLKLQTDHLKKKIQVKVQILLVVDFRPVT